MGIVTNLVIPCRWRHDCQDRIGMVTGYEIVYCSIKDEMDVHQICTGRNLTQEISRPEAEQANLTYLTPWTLYKVKMRIIFSNYPSQGSANHLTNSRLYLRSWCE